MRMKTFMLGMAGAAGLVTGSLLTTSSVAQDGIFVPNLTYRTGPFSNSGIPIANGIYDYLAMLNARDGGIGGAKIILVQDLADELGDVDVRGTGARARGVVAEQAARGLDQHLVGRQRRRQVGEVALQLVLA